MWCVCLHMYCYCSVAHYIWLFVTPWTAARQASLSLTISWSLPKLMSIPSLISSSHLILWCPLLLLPSVFPSIRDLSNESAVFIRRPKYGSFSFSISPSNEYSLLIFLMIDWFDLLAVQGTFRSLLQHHSSKALILWHSAFFIVQFSNLAWPLTHNGISLSYKKWNLAIFNSMGGPGRYCFNWSHTEKEKYMHLLIWGIIKYTNISKWKKTHRSEKKLVIVRQEWDGGWWNKWNGLRGTSLQILNKCVIGI